MKRCLQDIVKLREVHCESLYSTWYHPGEISYTILTCVCINIHMHECTFIIHEHMYIYNK